MTRPTARGFTLLELLIAMVITGILATMVFMTFVTQKRSYEAQNMLARTDAALRQAMLFLSREVANAGFGMNSNGQSLGADGMGGIDGMPLVFLQVWQGVGVGNPDTLSVTYMDPDANNWFFVNFSGDDMTVQATPCNTTTLPVRPIPAHLAAASQLQAGDTILCFTPIGRNFGTNGTGGTASFSFKVGGAVDGAGNLPVSSNGGIAGVDGFDSVCTSSLPEMVCAPKVQRSFYVDNTGNGIGPGTPEKPVLMMSERDDFDALAAKEDNRDIPLSYSIEDLQVDVCNVGNNCRATGVWDTALIPDWSLANMQTLESVAIRIAARSERKDPNGGRRWDPVVLDGAAGTVGSPVGTTREDLKYFRRQAVNEVHLRNARGAFLVSALGSGGATLATTPIP